MTVLRHALEVRVQASGLRVRVRDGEVMFENNGRSERAGSGVEPMAAANGIVTVRQSPSFGSEWDWTTIAAPVFKVEDTMLSEFMTWAIREGAWTLQAPSAILELARSTKLPGGITGLMPAEALAVVLPACGLTATFSDGRLLIRQVAAGGGSL